MPFSFNGNTPATITYNGNDVKTVTYNGVTVWEKAAASTATVYATDTRGWNSSTYPTALQSNRTMYFGACNSTSKRAAILQFSGLGAYKNPSKVVLHVYRKNSGSYACRFFPRDDYTNWSINTVISYSTSTDAFEIPGVSGGGWVDVDITTLWPTILEALNADDGTVWICIKNNYNTMTFDGDVSGENCPYLVIDN